MADFSVCFVCTGNICRSPTAEAVCREKLSRLASPLAVAFGSAGTHGYHVGEPPDPRSIAAAAVRGYDMKDLRARKFQRADIPRFDLILAMDRGHQAELEKLALASQRHKIRLVTAYSRLFRDLEVPDPYYGDGRGFARVLDMLEDAADGLISAIAVNRGAQTGMQP